MRGLHFTPIVLALCLATVAAAEEFDGSVPMECTALKGHDCLPDQKQCNRLKPEGGKNPVLGIDVANKQVRSPYRTSLLSILHTTTNQESLVLQGADLQFAWSALINKATGAMTVSIADRKGAYVVFGQCKLAATQPQTN
jgi:hypothetical protein